MIKEQLTLPLCYEMTNVYAQTGTSCTVTMTYGYCVSWTRDEILRDNVKRIWAGFALVMIFAFPIIGIILLS